VSEAAVIGIPDEIKGQRIFAFVTLKAGITESDDLKKTLIKTVREQIGQSQPLRRSDGQKPYLKRAQGKLCGDYYVKLRRTIHPISVICLRLLIHQ